MNKNYLGVLLLILGMSMGCKKETANLSGDATSVSLKNAGRISALPASYAKGADIGWASEMAYWNMKWYYNNGTEGDLMDILKSKGINSVRFRVWVNPSSGWCNKADVVTQAIKAKAKGLRVMIDFHYSDSWADPGQQTKPAAWNGQNITDLKASVAAHTTDVLNALKAAGVTPEWVQVGNETNNGMLWEEGKATVSMANFAGLVNAGYDAVKSVFPTAKVIVHISNGFDNGLFRWVFDGLKANGGKWDVVGMSLYPTKANYASLNTQCLANMQDMVTRYGKQVMVVEVGMERRDASTCKLFLQDIMTKNASLAGGAGLGVLYWEPQNYTNWSGYSKGAFTSKGLPSVAMDAFLMQ